MIHQVNWKYPCKSMANVTINIVASRSNLTWNDDYYRYI